MTPSFTREMISSRYLMNFGRFFLPLAVIFLISHPSARAQEKCDECSVPSFASLTVYQTLETGPAMGFGIEAGKWKKDAGRFSYFLGTSMIWSGTGSVNQKTADQHKTLNITFYWKGQYRVADRVYLIAQPGMINLSSFEMRTAIRYVFPLTRVMGIGLEPGYGLINRQWSVNTNIHFALK
jgi:hypothetical protein